METRETTTTKEVHHHHDNSPEPREPRGPGGGGLIGVIVAVILVFLVLWFLGVFNGPQDADPTPNNDVEIEMQLPEENDAPNNGDVGDNNTE